MPKLSVQHKRKTYRILHLPTCVAGFSASLSHELNILGTTSRVWSYSQNYLGYECNRYIFGSSKSKVVKEVKRILAMRYVFSYDIVVFNYGSTLFSPLGCDMAKREDPLGEFLAWLFRYYLILLQRIELFLLKFMRKTIVVFYLGDDARQGDYSLLNFSESIAKHVPDNYYTSKSDMLKRSQIRLLHSYASHVYAVNPDLLHLLASSARFVPYFAREHSRYKERSLCSISEPMRFVHAPTNRACKGTDKFITAIKSLQAKGINCHLDLIENLSHSEALVRYMRSHILLDQLYAGWYGTVAVEGMAMGIPSAAFIRESDLTMVPADMAAELPIIRISSDTLCDDLLTVTSYSSEQVKNLSINSFRYVRKWHYGPSIARSLLSDWTSSNNDV